MNPDTGALGAGGVAAAPERHDPARLRRVVTASVVGNLLEWYDFAVYGYFAAAIGARFFPATDPTASLIAALGVFAAGFLARPLGGLLFGHVADRIGRRQALLASVALMAVPTFLIGLLPDHAAIGLAAPALLLLLRVLQGLSVGGEYSTSIVYAVEHAPAERRGLVASLVIVGACGGILLGSGIGSMITALLPAEAVSGWGWRIPFLLGIALGAVGLLLRRGLVEAEAEAAAGEAAEGAAAAGPPVVAAFRTAWPAILRIVAVSALVGVGFYILFVYSVTYIRQVLARPMSEAFDVNTASVALLLVTMPAGAALSDRIGRRAVLGLSGLAMLVLAWPLFRLLHHPDPAMVLLAQLGFAVAMGPFLGTMPVVFAEAFPRRMRCSAASISYNLGMAVFGGMSPMAAAWLIERTHDDMMPAILIMATAVVSLAAVATLPETARRPMA